MHVNGVPQRTIWLSADDPEVVEVIDQRRLPHEFVVARINDVETAARAISEMWVRGAPLIGATAAWGMYLAARSIPARCDMKFWFEEAYGILIRSRPTAVNLRWALDRMLEVLHLAHDPYEAAVVARRMAAHITEEDVRINSAIGDHGLSIIRDIYTKKKDVVHVMTHCNAGWLATVDWGTATSPIYKAHSEGIPVHVWVDETRPRNQGASLTAWELKEEGVPCTLITDNAGGHIMQQGKVDLLLAGTDRTDRAGNVCNKIGTYLKALAAFDNQVPFYVALPSPTIDWTMKNAFEEIVIEERDPNEVLSIEGKAGNNITRVQLAPEGVNAANPAFDITPAGLVTGLITERGVCAADTESMLSLFPEQAE